MMTDFPSIVAQQDEATGQKYYMLDDAKKIVAALVDMPLAHDTVMYCGFRTKAMISRMLIGGINPESIDVVSAWLKDVTGQGALDAYQSLNVMHNLPKESEQSFLKRAHASEGDLIAKSVCFSHEGVEYKFQEKEGDQGEARIFIEKTQKESGDPYIYSLATPSNPDKYSNHVVPMLRVKDEDGAIKMMAIDTAQNKTQPITVEAWRGGMNFSEAILFTEGLDKRVPFHLSGEYLTDAQFGEVTGILYKQGLLGASSPEQTSRDQVEKILSSLDDAATKGVLMAFMKLQLTEPTTKLGDEHDLNAYGYAMSKQLLRAVDRRHDSDLLKDNGQYIGRATEVFAPYRAYVAWLEQTKARDLPDQIKERRAAGYACR